MGEDVTMDEAANTALLLEQHIQHKLALALADFMFGDTIASIGSVRTAVETENMPYAAMVVRDHLILQMVRSDVFKSNLLYMVKGIIRDEVGDLRRMVREEFTRGIIHNTHNSNRTG